MKRKLWILLALMALVCWSTGAMALPFTDGKSTANFTLNTATDILTVVLTNNIATAGAETDVALTALFWNGCNTSALTTGTAALTSGSNVIQFPAFVPGSDLGKENAYKFFSSSPPVAGINQGIGNAGLGVFGETDQFTSGNLTSPPVGLNGVDFAIVGPGYVTGSGAGVFGTEPLVQNSMTFTFTGVTNDNYLDCISNVQFNYGTALDNPVPLPGAVLLLGTGMARLVAYARRRKE